MDAQTASEAETAKIELHGAAIREAGVEFVLSVPDIVTSDGLLRPIANDPGFRLVRVCKEDECIGIASGLHYSDRRALILIQYTGFLDSLNAIRAVAVEYRQPICMMVGLLGHEPELPPSRDATAYAPSSLSATSWGSRIISSARIPTSPKSSRRSKRPMRIRSRSRCSSAGGPLPHDEA